MDGKDRGERLDRALMGLAHVERRTLLGAVAATDREDDWIAVESILRFEASPDGDREPPDGGQEAPSVSDDAGREATNTRQNARLDRVDGGTTMPDADRVRVVQAVHRHLPKLDSDDFVEWDADAGRVRRGSRFEDVEPFLEFVDEHEDLST